MVNAPFIGAGIYILVNDWSQKLASTRPFSPIIFRTPTSTETINADQNEGHELLETLTFPLPPPQAYIPLSRHNDMDRA